MSVVCLFCMCIRMLVQSISVFLLAVFLWALLPEIKWMMKMDDIALSVYAVHTVTTSGESNLACGRIPAARGPFNHIHQAALFCTPVY